MSSAANDKTVLVGGASAATNPVVHLCVRCGGVLSMRLTAPDVLDVRSHTHDECIEELRRALFAMAKRVEELEAERDG